MARCLSLFVMARCLSLFVALLLGVLLLGVGFTREVPIGGLRGRVTMTENGRPLANAMVSIEALGADDGIWRPRYDTTDENGNYEFPRLPVGAYRLTVSTKAHSAKTKVAVVEEGKQTAQNLPAEPTAPRLELYASRRVFSPREEPAVELHGFVPQDSVQVQITRLSPREVTRQGGLVQALGPWAHSEIEKPFDKALGQTVVQTTHRLQKRDAEGTFVEPLPLPKLSEGFYWVRVKTDEVNADTVISVSQIALIAKRAGNRVLGYVTDLQSGKPVGGAAVSQRKGQGVVPVGKTDPDGLIQFALAGDDHAAVLAQSGPSAAVCDFYGESQATEGKGKARIYTYTDRPVYRPGDTVNFKGIVRRLSGSDYQLPGQGTATVEVLDSQENVVANLSLPVSEHGTFHGSYTSSSESTPGPYQLRSKALGGQDDHYFPIAAYRKPEFTVEVSPERPWMVYGDRGSATVECKYFFGGPVVGAKVTATIFRSPRWNYGGGEEDELYEEEGGDAGYAGGGEYSEEVEATTDANGRATIPFNTRAKGDPKTPETDYDYTVSVTVAESGDKYVTGEGTIPVVQAAFGLDLTTDLYVASPGERIPLTLKTRQHDEDRSPVAGRAVTVVVGREEWQRGESNFVPLRTEVVQTGSDGTARLEVPVERSESLTIRAEARDDQGRRVTSETYVYVEGDTGSRNPRAGKLSLTLDRRSYAEGDSAKAVIQCDKPGGVALLTIESEGIVSQRTVPLSSAATTVRVPVTKEFVPNAFVSVAYVREGSFMEASKRLVVDLGVRKLQMTVTSDRPDAKPGETVNLTVRTADAQGRPVPAEVSLGVVDESVYAIRKDATDPLKGMYPKRANEVGTFYSFAEVYLDGGDKSPANIPVRKRFVDTALWQPAFQTGPTGETTVSVQLPDNLTSWRATAVGATDASAVGVARSNFRARKELMVRLELPTFLVQGDRQRVVAIVNNDTGQDAEVNVALTPEGVSAKGELNARIRVPAGQPQSVSWDLETPSAGLAMLTAKAWIDGGASDGVQQTIPISPRGRLVREAWAGEARGSGSFRFQWRSAGNVGGLTLGISREIQGLSEQSLAYLIDFPYGCVEQTMSRFLPSVLVEKRLKDRKLAARIPKIAEDSLVRLANMQHEDGGWGWWSHDESELFMTAYVLDGLALAKQAGYTNPQIDVPKALEWARKRLAEGKKDHSRDQAYLAFAMAQHGESVSVPGLRESSDPSTIALSALASPQDGDLLNRLLTLAKSGPAGTTYWPNGEDQWGSEATAFALRALARLRRDDPVVPRAISHLVLQSQGGRWFSTRDTAAVLIALNARPERAAPPSDATVTILVNGRSLRTLTITDDSPSLRLDLSPAELAKGENVVEVRTADGSPVLYSAELRQYDERPAAKAVDGFQVSRQYRVLAPGMRWGQRQLVASGQPVQQATSGTVIECEVTVNNPTTEDFVMVEDPIPSNCRVIDPGSSADQPWDWWWSDMSVRDDRVTFFARSLPKGVSKFTYLMRVESPGVSEGLPTLVQNMYDPTSARWSPPSRMEVRP